MKYGQRLWDLKNKYEVFGDDETTDKNILKMVDQHVYNNKNRQKIIKRLNDQEGEKIEKEEDNYNMFNMKK